MQAVPSLDADRERAFARPRLKEVFTVLYLPGRIRIGSSSKYAVEADDPDGHYASLLRLLDGRHSLESIVESVRGRLSEAEVGDTLDMLWSEGYLAAAPPDQLPLTPQQRQRYRANLNFFDSLPRREGGRYAYQQKLSGVSVVQLGLGGIGSNVAVALAELGIGALTAVDFDAVDLSNLNRQVLYGTSVVGEAKVDVAARRLADLNPDLRFTGVRRRIGSADDVREILDAHPCDVVINLADKPNGWIDHWVNRACVERRLPLFAGVVNVDIATAYSVVPGKTACYNCRVEREFAQSPRLREELEHVRLHGIDDANGALGPSCMYLAYFLSMEVFRHVLEVHPRLTDDRTLEVDLLTFEHTFHSFPRLPDCDVCGRSTSG